MRTSASVACPILTIHASQIGLVGGADSGPQPIPGSADLFSNASVLSPLWSCDVLQAAA